jgi:hypothetical protein
MQVVGDEVVGAKVESKVFVVVEEEEVAKDKQV